jgi:hypothetical protein
MSPMLPEEFDAFLAVAGRGHDLHIGFGADRSSSAPRAAAHDRPRPEFGSASVP